MKENTENIVIYESNTKNVSLEVNILDKNVWLSQAQMTELFDRDRTVITKHINNIFNDGELEQGCNVQNLHIANSDKPVKFYSLDVVISVGYRVKSIEGTRFRQWATGVLRNHIIDGYTLNKQRLQKNYTNFSEAVAQVKSVIKSAQIDNDAVIELISMFANTWLSLDAYDKDQLPPSGTSKKKVTLTADKLNLALQELKQNLMSKGEATELFARERSKDSISGIIGNVVQSFDGEDLYPTIEEKAAHLLYFIVKNHPFADGNKRSGAYSFIWFLQKNKMLNLAKINPPALTAITLLIAESNPKEKDKMIGLICKLLGNN